MSSRNFQPRWTIQNFLIRILIRIANKIYNRLVLTACRTPPKILSNSFITFGIWYLANKKWLHTTQAHRHAYTHAHTHARTRTGTRTQTHMHTHEFLSRTASVSKADNNPVDRQTDREKNMTWRTFQRFWRFLEDRIAVWCEACICWECHCCSDGWLCRPYIPLWQQVRMHQYH